MSCRYFLFLIIFIANLPQSTLAALIDLSITRPKSDFTTSNQQLTIEGIVEISVPSDVLISVNTPAGARNLATMADSLYSITADFEIPPGIVPMEIVAILLTPFRSGKYYFGPRKVIASFSFDGVDFDNELSLFFPSIDEDSTKAIVEFPEPISTRFVQLDMVEGWQVEQSDEGGADKILIEKLEFLNTEQKVIQPRIQSISTLLDLKTQKRANFALTVLLREGENRITVVAKLLAKKLPDNEAKEVLEVLSLFYMPELIPEKAVKGQFVLSDGYKARVTIPVNALDERIRRLQIISVDPAQEFNEGASPVLIYRFEASRQGFFPAEATAYLEGQPPALSVDGIYHPPSTWITSFAPLPVKLTVDLLKPYTISKIVVYAKAEDGKSFAPQKAKILVSNDKKSLFAEPDRYQVAEYANFSDEITEVPLSTFPTGQYVQLLIEESKQANIIQLNEVEFWDESGAKIVSYVTMTNVYLQRPATLQFSYYENDLMRANVKNEANLRFFAWDEQTEEWQFAGGVVDAQENTVSIQLNYLQKLALFETTKDEIEVSWSFNPFSPDGNGIADTTLLILNLKGEMLKTNPQVIVQIFDLTGKLISTLIDHELTSLPMSVRWDGKDKTGRIVDIGPYIYQIKIGNQVKNGVIVVAK
ncbi:discoidin domain-containing protein [bacterium]|nr:discoidin domain-containing protein [bacterium]